LGNLNNKSANFLKEIYVNQADPDIENRFDEYVDKSRFQDLYKEVERKAKIENYGVAEFTRGILSYMPYNNNFRFPFSILGTEEKTISTKVFTVIEKRPTSISSSLEDSFLVLTKEEIICCFYWKN
jgi:hypothetical protein